MIDFNKAQEAFSEYLNNYDKNDSKIRLKIKHTYEVVNQSEYISKGLNLDEENIEIAKIIALLHDIGRFEQIKVTSDFIDTDKLDHADFGAKILFEDNLIHKFIETNKYDNLIKTAIINHNKLKIEDNLDKDVELHCKIIRDADKLDNFRVKEEEDFKDIFPNVYNPDTLYYSTISEKVYSDFMNGKCINVNDRKTQLDYWFCVIAFIFDLNFDISKKYILDKNYINILIDRIQYKDEETKKQMEDIRKFANDYLKESMSDK